MLVAAALNGTSLYDIMSLNDVLHISQNVYT
jgi:hypothetical protein